MLQAARSTKDGVLHITLSGVIDETVDLAPVFHGLPKRVALDLRGVERINSVGVRNWVALMRGLSITHDVTIQAVSYPLVIQASCVSCFFGGAVVESCMAPYFCPGCSRAEEVVVRRDQVTREHICSECGKPMEFDELDHYFGVLENGAFGA